MTTRPDSTTEEPDIGAGTDADAAGRPHTGRRRNEQVRRAILDAVMRLLARADGSPVTVDTIAKEAGVGKQTIYRWWPSKGAVFLDALTDHAVTVVPDADTGTLAHDLEIVIGASYTGAVAPQTAPVLTTLVREAAHDPHLAAMMRDFTAVRRAALHAVLERARARGELAEDADVELMVDQVYGVLWYRLLVGHAPLDETVANRLAATLTAGNAPKESTT
ncbi:TetR/AcrR family transcriptional regulator [Yinghuangia seranimata]|uniref:TetR/AcrR family transcriptional regulator n=1 Tax=Yinghuangia seranimata TaxID=408067 RepID=UPI00248B9992|nr:TetR/AcrR family transcriptional regulator [Yinghuangia seranimata]MDI2124877.1 TetR/AcrR family transcriptional regulator [Yinghuangia seranimata]